MKLKNYIYLLLCLVIMLPLFVFFVGCGNHNNKSNSQNNNYYKLNNDMTLKEGTSILFDGESKNAVLDLNGYCIKSNRSAAIQVTNGAKLTIIDSNKNTTHYLLYDENTHAYSKYSKTRPSGGVEIQDGHLPINKVNSYITIHGGLITGTNGNIYGGAIVVGCLLGYTGQPSFVEMQSGSIAGNISSGYGGGIFVGSNAKFVLNGGDIIGNYSSSFGGGISVEGQSSIELNSGKIAYNTAGVSGGAVYLMGNQYLKLTNLTIANTIQILYNQAKWGGGVAGIIATVSMQGGLIQGNRAIEGGGFDLYSSCFTMVSGKIIENSAEKKGGAILFGATEQEWTYTNENTGYHDEGRHLLKIDSGIIEKNSAAEAGGIYLLKVFFEATPQMEEYINKNNISNNGNSVEMIGTQNIKQNRI